MNFGYNPYFQQQYAPQMQRLQNLEQQYPQFAQQPPQQTYSQPQTYTPPALGLQGKTVESLEVAKIMEIPLDGSTSFFPLADGSAIITKQLQVDGTSKVTIYKPSTEPEEIKDEPKYVTEEQLKELLEAEPDEVEDLKEQIKELKRQLRDMSEDLKEMKKVKESKRKSDD